MKYIFTFVLFISCTTMAFADSARAVLFDMSVPDKEDNARILRFKLDEKNKQVLDTKSVPLNITAPYMGNAQELQGGRHFVGCGSSESCASKMVDASGQDILIMTVEQPYTTYRAYFYEDITQQ